MFKITLVNLSPGDLSPNLNFDVNEAGGIDQDQFITLLELFQALKSRHVHEADPHMLVESWHGKYRIRTGHGKLFLYDARDSAKPYAELSAAEIARLISAGPDAEQDDASPTREAPTRTPNRGIAFAMLLAGLCINGYTLYSVFYTDDVNQKPAITLITDPIELAARQHSVVGRYVTGNDPGDRLIAVEPDGRVHFGEIAAKGHRPEASDTYRIGRYENKLCLTTPESGVIDVTGLNTVVYYRDTYRRIK